MEIQNIINDLSNFRNISEEIYFLRQKFQMENKKEKSITLSDFLPSIRTVYEDLSDHDCFYDLIKESIQCSS